MYSIYRTYRCIYVYMYIRMYVYVYILMYIMFIYVLTYIYIYTFPFCYNWCHRWVDWGSMWYAGCIEFKPCEVSLFKLLVQICMGKVRGTQVGLVAIVRSASGKKLLGKIPQSSEWSSPTSMHSWKMDFSVTTVYKSKYAVLTWNKVINSKSKVPSLRQGSMH